ARGSEYESDRLMAIHSILPKLPAELRAEAAAAALATIRDMPEAKDRAESLRRLVPDLPIEAQEAALSIVCSLGNKWVRSDTLIRLIHVLPERLQAKAVAVLRQMGWDRQRIERMWSVVPTLDAKLKSDLAEELLDSALATSMPGDYEWMAVRALTLL